MPLPMVHLGVARGIAEKLHIPDLPAFYLGSIAPDGIFTREGFTREQKWRNHLINKDGVRTVDGILAFYKEYKHLDESFILGYTVHVLTDQLYNETVYQKYLERYENDLSPVQDKKWAYYNDTDIVDFELYSKSPWRDEVWHCLEQSRGIDVDGYIYAIEADAWRDRTLHWYDSGESKHKNPVRYITYEDEIVFIDMAAEDICRMIITLR